MRFIITYYSAGFVSAGISSFGACDSQGEGLSGGSGHSLAGFWVWGFRDV